ncbi:23S rRNA (pseudouridine(1915)-N(3))-methyltransferase RlmH [Sediminibacterium sp.]|jgi:23S rRNA (pseudouridine1915-N3)-methyltransferase|uniref:23S rRNA (pseudouridine(1915)-N(3))-methyltransferase RlmH n=1 Tax=Sediminibacterium sp. TaxID=1917865 RepID=UPI0025EFC249|nr:23S rRNA (pseudouridine(1915)-N(3))-methyltransferase RlmH [Sediminibacterium sp.]MDO8997474.1 23S rRNA (pseudouridine(1915)-N(3))-methyltransferase RlmH [Sediminibacterium sp.]MDP2422223.1 23S rRNA (pseudouridine(1915)-N(3))-methyltransferase RlmH [Sediminibacterium sp.]
MKLRLISVGKPHEPYVKEGINDFTQRLNKYFKADWLIIPTPKTAPSLSETELKKAEAALILHQIEKDDYLILLDERGKSFSSPQLAQFIQQRANESNKQLVFLIGGAFGVDPLVTNRAQQVWSLSQLVFPHMLARLILSEQLYRACTIIRNEKYHHI